MSWITDVGEAIATVVRSFQLKRKEPPLKRQHFWQQDGTCMYCHVAMTAQNEAGLCPYFT